MKTPANVRRLILFLLMGALMTFGQAQAAISCHKINAKGAGQDLGGGVTQAHIIGGGLLHGTTVGNFTVTGFSFPIASIGGTVVFTTHDATLTVTVAGIFDVVSGEFSATGPVTDATGKLAGATGTLMFDGLENLSNGRFEEDVTGLICADLAP